jgi:hypothetical protein
MDPTFLMLVLLMLGAGMAIAAPIVFITLAAFIYVWTHAYPWLKMVGKWAAKPANFIALLAVWTVIFVFVMALAILVHPFMFLLILPALIILFPVYLAVAVWVVRLIKFVFSRLSGFIDGVFLAARLEFIKLKIKTDGMREAGGKGKLGALRSEFADDARVVTGRVSDKKQGGIRGKLEALRGEFSSDVDKARSRFGRRK